MLSNQYKLNGAMHQTELLIEKVEPREQTKRFTFPVTFQGAAKMGETVHATMVSVFGFSEDHARKRLLKMSMDEATVGQCVR